MKSLLLLATLRSTSHLKRHIVVYAPRKRWILAWKRRLA
jgi:hypothetical protein